MEPHDDELVTKSLTDDLAQTQFGQILERVSKHHDRFVVTKNGEPKAVIMGIEDFLQAVAKTPESLAALQLQALASGASQMTLEEIESEIEAVRHPKATPQSS